MSVVEEVRRRARSSAAIAVADQALVSGVNFATTVLLVRGLARLQRAREQRA